MPIAVPSSETRTRIELEEDYELERELADRLRRASPKDRRTLYGEVYDRYHRESNAARDVKSGSHRERAVDLEYGLVASFFRPDSSFLEIGAGDAALAQRAAGEVGSIHVLEASEAAMDGIELADNCSVLVCDATRIELPKASVDVAYSCHFIEHLHPEDAITHAGSLLEVLAPGGVSICVTPNRHWGPHDISRYFDDRPRGFHLQEYDHADLGDLFRDAGFARVASLRGFGSRIRNTPILPYRLLRSLLAPLSLPRRRALLGLASRGRSAPFRRLEQVAIAAWRRQA